VGGWVGVDCVKRAVVVAISPFAASVDGSAGVVITIFAAAGACCSVAVEQLRQLVAAGCIAQACAPVMQHDILQPALPREAVAPARGVKKRRAIESNAAAPRIEAIIVMACARPFFSTTTAS